ncbi:hypothetical protein EFP84_01025 [Leptospira kmetyi]|uniref:Uncharacterized protein n=1 Tax=Leptospira kmetyi TaxID=408139 RepID=A0AAD0XMD8_9LEPT|nr:hypothetical protein EFP84_01025 [Leptospira kmetyi]
MRREATRSSFQTVGVPTSFLVKNLRPSLFWVGGEAVGISERISYIRNSYYSQATFSLRVLSELRQSLNPSFLKQKSPDFV